MANGDMFKNMRSDKAIDKMVFQMLFSFLRFVYSQKLDTYLRIAILFFSGMIYPIVIQVIANRKPRFMYVDYQGISINLVIGYSLVLFVYYTIFCFFEFLPIYKKACIMPFMALTNQ
ncbi:MAG: hypothetical protein D6732_17640 [Methanobacteriota archaeon]|nr:MAG: hypothetical protein D6732_17640 [Euryarchaeota archaeon]